MPPADQPIPHYQPEAYIQPIPKPTPPSRSQRLKKIAIVGGIILGGLLIAVIIFAIIIPAQQIKQRDQRRQSDVNAVEQAISQHVSAFAEKPTSISVLQNTDLSFYQLGQINVHPTSPELSGQISGRTNSTITRPSSTNDYLAIYYEATCNSDQTDLAIGTEIELAILYYQEQSQQVYCQAFAIDFGA